MLDLKKIQTESRNQNTLEIDTYTPLEIVEAINLEDYNVAKAIDNATESIAKVVEEAAECIKFGGRIIYIGAGTSGRLGVLDAVECPPTFGVSKDVVIGLIAGGDAAFVTAVEGAEDSKELCIADLKAINLNTKDIVIGVAASGRTPYVIGGLEYAKIVGAKTASIAITSDSEIAKYADYPIEVVVGPEVITGSTRMKAGSAQKMILNMISTGSMILNGKVYQNLMVDVMQNNDKLVVRAQNIVIDATGCSRKEAINLLKQANGNSKTAILMYLKEIDYQTAIELLDENNGNLRKCL